MKTLAELRAEKANLQGQIAPLAEALREIQLKIDQLERPWNEPEVEGKCCEEARSADALNVGADGKTYCPTCGREA